jgi:Family of unknown function (DUF6527)
VPADRIKYEFVEAIPDRLDDGVVYVSATYATVLHLCCCGCGTEVITPLSPTDWKITFDGVSITLHPSIGNWSFPCRSHYWINNSCVRWAEQWSDEEVTANREHARLAKHRYRSRNDGPSATAHEARPLTSRLRTLTRRLRRSH